MGWRSTFAGWLDPQMARDAREFRLLKRGESLEFRLQRRIHNQRVRLRQMEMFSGWQREARAYNKSRWLDVACRAIRENKELRQRLGVAGSFK